MNDAMLNIFGDLGDSDPAHAFCRQEVYLPPKQRLKILCQFDKLEPNRSLELDDKIDVTFLIKLPFCVRTKQANALDAVTGGERWQILLQQRDDLLSVQLPVLLDNMSEPNHPPANRFTGAYTPQRSAGVWTGASQRRNISSSARVSVIEQPCISSEVM